VGEKIRLFVGNGGPNLTSSFHLIGEIFDNVYPEGGTTVTHNVQTTSIPPGGAAIVELQVQVPGTYILVDHALFRAFNKGALGMLRVDGPPDLSVYTGKEVDAVYIGKAADAGSEAEKNVRNLKAQVAEEIRSNPKIADLTKEIQIEKGKAVYMQTCFVCHQPNGIGVANQIPPLAKSDFLAGLTKDDYIRGVVMGRNGEITVNGKTYNGTMVPLNYLTDEQIANVLTYVRNSFGNTGDAVSIDDVKKVRAQVASPPSQSAFE
jgi:nitrite reductase (NO-forming)